MANSLAAPSSIPLQNAPSIHSAVQAASVADGGLAPGDYNADAGSADAQAMWHKCAESAKQSDTQVAGDWNGEIDPLLTFAGLFSAALTAFIVPVYSALSADFATSPDKAPSTALIWINTLWFYSLILSLFSAVIGIIAKQWLSHFTSSTPSDPICSTYIHCVRWDQGVIAWRVPLTLSLIPVFLLLALVLFVVGLAISLWSLNTTLAVATTPLIVLLLGFVVFTTFAPVWSSTCPYKSLQALVAYWAVKGVAMKSRNWIDHVARYAVSHKTITPCIPMSYRPSMEGSTDVSGTWMWDWMAQEQVLMDKFLEKIIVPHLSEMQHDPNATTLWWFKGFTEVLQPPSTYTSQGAIGEIAIVASEHIPDALVCDFVESCGIWLVENMPLTHESLVKLIDLAHRCSLNDTSENMKTTKSLIDLIINRETLVLSLLMDNWHNSESQGSAVIGHRFVDALLERAIELINSPSASHVDHRCGATCTYAAHTCNLAARLMVLLPGHTPDSLQEFQRCLQGWEDGHGNRAMTRPARLYLRRTLPSTSVREL